MIYLRQNSPEVVGKELLELEMINEEGNKDVENWYSQLKMLLLRSSLIPMTVLVFLFSVQSFCGSNMVSYYTVNILQVRDIRNVNNINNFIITDGRYSAG